LTITIQVRGGMMGVCPTSTVARSARSGITQELVDRRGDVALLHESPEDMSRHALDDLGVFYEDAAFDALGQGDREQARAGKRR
jgi:hypothetical protein